MLFLQRKHMIKLREVFFVDSTALKNYTESSTVARFSLRDDILSKKLNNSILMVKSPIDVSLSFSEGDTESSTHCLTCFEVALSKALQISDFDLVNEWLFDVPLDIQLFLETFINRETLRKTTAKSELLGSKLTKLYSLYDIALNTFNRNHFGIHQHANTEEICMHYHSLNTIFSVTSRAGITTGIRMAEEQIKEKANGELCYYNTYMKPYHMVYETMAGEVDTNVNLQQCHLILVLDNLVRLSYRKDPVPGESRSFQLCTLPITLQGLPRNSAVTELWHDHETCDGSTACACKLPQEYAPENIYELLLTPSAKEKTMHEKFQQFCVWANMSVWIQMNSDGR